MELNTSYIVGWVLLWLPSHTPVLFELITTKQVITRQLLTTKQAITRQQQKLPSSLDIYESDQPTHHLASNFFRIVIVVNMGFQIWIFRFLFKLKVS